MRRTKARKRYAFANNVRWKRRKMFTCMHITVLNLKNRFNKIHVSSQQHIVLKSPSVCCWPFYMYANTSKNHKSMKMQAVLPSLALSCLWGDYSSNKYKTTELLVVLQQPQSPQQQWQCNFGLKSYSQLLANPMRVSWPLSLLHMHMLHLSYH